MKKIITAIISAAMLAVQVPAFQAPCALAAEVNDTDAMEKAILAVKSKIDIPQELTEFSSESSDYEGQTRFYFQWSAPEGAAYISVETDRQGRIASYRMEKNYSYHESKLISMSREEIRAKAEDYITRLAPETVANENDRLVLESVSSAVYGYNASFVRMKDGVRVAQNNANLSLDFSGNEIVGESVSISYDYDASFETAAQEIADAPSAYRASFPEEMVYQKEYERSDRRRTAGEIKLVYRINDGGYISAYTGDKVEPKLDDILYRNEASMDMSAQKTSAGGLSAQEIANLETISGLYAPEEAEGFLRSLPQIKVTDDMVRKNTRLMRSFDNKDEYSLALYLSRGDMNEDWRDLSANFDASRGYLTYLQNYHRYDNGPETLSEQQKEQVNSLMDGFLTGVTDKLGEYELVSVNDDSGSREYRRIVNGVPYVDDTLVISADPEMVTYYSLSYENNAQFASPAQALDKDAGYAALLEAAPLERLYLPAENGYRLVYTRNNSVRTDALTGKRIGAEDRFNASDAEYNDISGHWCEEAVISLRDNGIAIKGESFFPDQEMTQSDILRLFASGVKSKSFADINDEDLYRLCMSMNILTKEEKDAQAAVTRERAFIYLVRMIGYDEVAKLSDIYKVTYADGGQLGDGNIGYAAILSGMGVIEGDGGILRPQENITRAEAAMMLYRYMKK